MPRPPKARVSFAQDRATLMRIARALLAGEDTLPEWRVEAYKHVTKAIQVMADGELHDRLERKVS